MGEGLSRIQRLAKEQAGGEEYYSIMQDVFGEEIRGSWQLAKREGGKEP